MTRCSRRAWSIDGRFRGPRGTTGTVLGPRRFGAYDVVWRIRGGDTAFTPAVRSARSRVERAFQGGTPLKDETEAKGYFEQHARTTRRAQVRDRVRAGEGHRPTPSRSPETDLRKFWQQHRTGRFGRGATVRARHILIRPGPMPARPTSLLRESRADRCARNRRRRGLSRSWRRNLVGPGSGAQGGDTGIFNRTAMVKELPTLRSRTRSDAGEPDGQDALRLPSDPRRPKRRPKACGPFEEVRDESRL